MHDYDAIDRKKLYNEKGLCRLCTSGMEGNVTGTHEADCPGRILDALTYEIAYEGHGTHGDRGVEGRVQGNDLPKLYAEVAGEVLEHGGHVAELRYIVELTCVNEEVSTERKRLVAKIVAEREAKAQKIIAAKALLRKERVQAMVECANRFTSGGGADVEAYERELAAIDEKYKGRL